MGKIGKELIESAEEALAIARGAKAAPLRFDGDAMGVPAIRQQL